MKRKSEEIQEVELERITELFKVMSDPVRLKIICYLMKNDLCVGDLCELLDMSQPAVSHQLRVMRNTRVVKAQKKGTHAFYSLSDKHIYNLFEQARVHINEN